MRPALRTLLILAGAALPGCAGSPASLPAPSPAEIPGLEALVASEPSDPEAALLLAAAYRESGRTDDALAVVARARSGRRDGGGALAAMEGVLHEERGAEEAAREAYGRYLATAPDGPLRAEVSARLEGLRREALRADVRAALAREAELADVAPDPAAVGVFPFAVEGDEGYAPLGRALAELLVTDLGVTGRLRVLERVAVQALVDELSLGASGLVEPSTAARGGRLLGSGHLVQGRVRVAPGDTVALDVAVVRVGDAGAVDVRPIEGEDALARLLDLEKRVALDVHDELGIVLTPAERARVDERQTESVQALLAFGRGLAAADAGDVQAAERAFAQAAELDPGFRLARERRERLGAVQAGMERLRGQAVGLAQKRRAVQALRQAPAALRRNVLRNLTDRQRSALAEVLGQDRLGTSILLELVFRRPGGSR